MPTTARRSAGRLAVLVSAGCTGPVQPDAGPAEDSAPGESTPGQAIPGPVHRSWNGVVVAGDAVYVSDFNAMVYRAALRGDEVGELEPWLDLAPFAPPSPEPKADFLNDIVAADGGAVLLAGTERMYRIDVASKQVRVVDMGDAPWFGAEHLLLEGRTLYTAAPFFEPGGITDVEIQVARLSDDLTSGRVVARIRDASFRTVLDVDRHADRLLVANSQAHFFQNPTLPFTVGTFPDPLDTHSDHPSGYALPEGAGGADGIGVAEDGTLYATSASTGAVYRGRVDQPRLEQFLPAGSDGRTSARAVRPDPRGRVFVAGGDTGALFVYDPGGGLVAKRAAPLPGAALNDLAFTQDAVYVTDSAKQVIYRAAVRDGEIGELESWVDVHPVSQAPPARRALNGLVTGLDGRVLLAGDAGSGDLRSEPARTLGVAIEPGSPRPAHSRAGGGERCGDNSTICELAVGE